MLAVLMTMKSIISKVIVSSSGLKDCKVLHRLDPERGGRIPQAEEVGQEDSG